MNYEITDKIIGKGSFSTVYLAKRNNEDIAVKVIDIKSLTAKTVEAMEDEINVINLIKDNVHPNIVAFFDIIRKNDKIYIFMEYCESGDLRRILKKPILEKYAQFYFSQLANGLRHLHRLKIIHRDIKPRNILLTGNRRVLKIADFGFSKFTDGTLHDTICGSPMYMAPEIMKRLNYNEQTDLWSVGMILYEMLYGYHPYDKCMSIPDLKNVIENEQLEIPPKNNNTNKLVSNECLTLLRLLLQKNVTNRITWNEFFDHPWLTLYKYTEPISMTSSKGSTSKYDEQLKRMSIGSILSNEDGSFKTKMANIEIINSYYGVLPNKETIAATNNDDDTSSSSSSSSNSNSDPDKAVFSME